MSKPTVAYHAKATTAAPPLQVTIKEAARLLSLGERTIYRLLDTHELVSVGNGRRRRVLYTSLLAYQQREMTGAS